MITTTPPPELPEAACAGTDDPEAFFLDEGPRYERAKTLCRSCPVRTECLTWAIAHNEYGLWGGVDEDQRDRHLFAAHADQPTNTEDTP